MKGDGVTGGNAALIFTRSSMCGLAEDKVMAGDPGWEVLPGAGKGGTAEEVG